MTKRIHTITPAGAHAPAGVRATALALACAVATAFAPATAAAEGTSLSVASGSAALGPFVPGIEQTYATTVTATVSATDPGAVLTIADPDATAPGHLVNGAFALRHPLTASATSAVAAGTGFAPVGPTGAPLTLLTYLDPVSDDLASISFRQAIDPDEPLSSGQYGKTLLLTLSTGSP